MISSVGSGRKAQSLESHVTPLLSNYVTWKVSYFSAPRVSHLRTGEMLAILSECWED